MIEQRPLPSGFGCQTADGEALAEADLRGNSGVRPWAVDKAAAEALWILSEKLTSVVSAKAIA